MFAMFFYDEIAQILEFHLKCELLGVLFDNLWSWWKSFFVKKNCKLACKLCIKLFDNGLYLSANSFQRELFKHFLNVENTQSNSTFVTFKKLTENAKKIWKKKLKLKSTHFLTSVILQPALHNTKIISLFTHKILCTFKSVPIITK